MTILSALFLVATIAYLTLMVMIVVRNPRSSLNWVCAGVLLCLGFWSFTDIFPQQRPALGRTHPVLRESRHSGLVQLPRPAVPLQPDTDPPAPGTSQLADLSAAGRPIRVLCVSPVDRLPGNRLHAPDVRLGHGLGSKLMADGVLRLSGTIRRRRGLGHRRLPPAQRHHQ